MGDDSKLSVSGVPENACPPSAPTESRSKRPDEPVETSETPAKDPGAPDDSPSASVVEPGPEQESASAGSPAPDVDAEPSAETEASATSSKTARRRPKDRSLARAFRTGRPVQGKVDKAIKGGFEVRVGKSRAFCPFSQMDLHRVEKPEEYIDRAYYFRVIQYRRAGEDVVLSRRALLEEERSDEAKAVRATLIEGAVMQGRVASVADFGAFVDLGAGVMGLVHISELAHARVQEVGDAVKVGDRVPVKILKIDDSSGRISLSIRLAQDDPWKEAAERFRVGQVYSGAVRRLTDFGAFVELGPGIEALAPARDFPPSPDGWSQGLELGQERDWMVLEVSPERHRLTIVPSPPEGTEPLPATLESGRFLKGKVQKVERFGVFVWLGPGKVGLIPNVWTGTARGANLRQLFPVGKDVEVEVVEVADGGRRIRLGVKGVPREPLPERARKEERPPARSKARSDEAADDSTTPLSTTFGTSMGDVLRAALRKRDDKK